MKRNHWYETEAEFQARRKQRRENLRTIGLGLLLAVANFLIFLKGPGPY